MGFEGIELKECPGHFVEWWGAAGLSWNIVEHAGITQGVEFARSLDAQRYFCDGRSSDLNQQRLDGARHRCSG